MQTQKSGNGVLSFRETTNAGMALMEIGGSTLEVFLHHTFGEERLKRVMWLAPILMCFYALAFPNDNPRPYGYFICAFFVLAAMHQIGAVIRRWRGRDRFHSTYTGTPCILWIFPFLNESFVKWMEPFVTFGIGYGVHHFNRPLGSYLMWASYFLFMSVAIRLQYQRERDRALKDALVEQNTTAARVRRVQR